MAPEQRHQFVVAGHLVEESGHAERRAGGPRKDFAAPRQWWKLSAGGLVVIVRARGHEAVGLMQKTVDCDARHKWFPPVLRKLFKRGSIRISDPFRMSVRCVRIHEPARMLPRVVSKFLTAASNLNPSQHAQILERSLFYFREPPNNSEVP